MNQNLPQLLNNFAYEAEERNTTSNRTCDDVQVLSNKELEVLFQTPQKLQKKVIKKKSTKNQRFIYQCDMCPQTFTQLFNMHNHIKNIHQLNPHVCPQCSPQGSHGIRGVSAFSHVRDLKEHARKHHQGKLIRLKRDQKIYLSEEEFQIRMKNNFELQQQQQQNLKQGQQIQKKNFNEIFKSYQQQLTQFQQIPHQQLQQQFVQTQSWNCDKTQQLLKQEEDEDDDTLMQELDTSESSKREKNMIQDYSSVESNSQYYTSQIILSCGEFKPFFRGESHSHITSSTQQNNSNNNNKQCGFRMIPTIIPFPFYIKQEN